MIRCIAIDDEPSALDVISIHAAKAPELQLVRCFADPFEALTYIRENRIDLIFLDINMPGMSGMVFIKKLNYKIPVVFTTAYSEFALDSYDYDAVDYLLKPFDFERFNRAVQKAVKLLNAENGRQDPIRSRYLFIKDGYKQVKLTIEEISYIQGEGNYLSVFCGSARTMTRMTLGEMTVLLPDGLFFRVHNSYLVNLSRIDKIENNHIHIGEAAIPIGSKYREGFFLTIKG